MGLRAIVLGMRLLVIEDEAKMSAFLKRGLEEAGYAVEVAGSGGAAMAMASQNTYDLMILDVMLPDTNGFDMAREIRNQGFEGPDRRAGIRGGEDGPHQAGGPPRWPASAPD